MINILIQGRSCHHFDDLWCMITICKVQFTVTVDNDYSGHPKASKSMSDSVSCSKPGADKDLCILQGLRIIRSFATQLFASKQQLCKFQAFICLRRKIGIACIHVVSLKFILYSISWYLESWGLCRIYYLWGILKLLQSVTGPPAAKRRILGESIWKQMQVRGFPVTRLSMLGRQFLNWSIISRY